jgi:predicted metal-dependent hydrolase
MPLALLRSPDPDHLEVEHAGASLRVALRRRPTARRITLRVSAATGEVVITIPTRTAVKTAQQFAASHSGWIAARLARVPARVLFEPGADVPLRGAAHRIHLRDSRSGAVRVERDGEAAVLSVACAPAHVARRIARRASEPHHPARHPQPLGILHGAAGAQLLMAPDPGAPDGARLPRSP